MGIMIPSLELAINNSIIFRAPALAPSVRKILSGSDVTPPEFVTSSRSSINRAIASRMKNGPLLSV